MIKQEIDERRKVERVAVSLPVSMANTDFITHDISASGVFIETDASYDLGDRVGFVVMFNKQGGHLVLKCNGEIVRVENRNSKVGVAVKIIDAVMESV